MAVELNQVLDPAALTAAQATMLDELQPNIVKAHVRDHLCLLFLRFHRRGEARALLHDLTEQMKSARQHIDEVAAFKAHQTPGTTYIGVGLTRAGYDKLGVTTTPADSAFRRGMKHAQSRATLADPPVHTWEHPYRANIHAVILIGDTSAAAVAGRRQHILNRLPASVTVLGEETGLGQSNENGDGLEHFGYVDGRSQPLFLTTEIADQQNSSDGTNVWDPATPADRVLLADPGAPDPSVHCGSYFVFRKLEQNVARFKQSEQDLADELGLTGEDREIAGAMIVGRFEDGTPLTIQNEEGSHNPVMNNFTYDSDLNAMKCPFHAHIRKTNPRGSGQFQPAAEEKKHLMARRGQTYGVRHDDINDGSLPPSQRPSGDVGLLFMAFNANISIEDNFALSQFEFTQNAWADNVGFPRVPLGHAAPGLDPIIGQGQRPDQDYPIEWGEPTTKTVPAIPAAVTMLGGEYFFMPSLAFLRGLSPGHP